jgi:hypothetical protein
MGRVVVERLSHLVALFPQHAWLLIEIQAKWHCQILSLQLAFPPRFSCGNSDQLETVE